MIGRRSLLLSVLPAAIFLVGLVWILIRRVNRYRRRAEDGEEETS